MRLYSVREDNADWEEAYWQLIWARNVDEAEEVYRRTYPYELELGLPIDHMLLRVTDNTNAIECIDEIAPESPGVEHSLEIQRLVGWQTEDDRYSCEKCGLYSMGIEKYELCPECACCQSCGCDEGCIELESGDQGVAG